MIENQREFVLLIPNVTAGQLQRLNAQKLLEIMVFVLKTPSKNVERDAINLADATEWIAPMLENLVAMKMLPLNAL